MNRIRILIIGAAVVSVVLGGAAASGRAGGRPGRDPGPAPDRAIPDPDVDGVPGLWPGTTIVFEGHAPSTTTTSSPRPDDPLPTSTAPSTTPSTSTTSPPTSPSTSTTSPPTTPSTPATTPPPEVTWVIGRDATPPAADRTRLPLGQASTDPVYRTPIRRVTSADGTRFDRNTYSRRQAENADGTRFLTYHGDAVYHVYDRITLDLVAVLPLPPGADPQWHPTDPRRLRHVGNDNPYGGTLELFEHDLDRGTSEPIADLTGRIRAVLPEAVYLSDRAEGSPSADGDRWAWIVHDGAGERLGVVSYDLSTDRVLGILPSLETGVGELDWVSASATGRYVVAGYWYATYVYDADLTNRREINDKGEHSDLAIDHTGGDAYVWVDFSTGPDAGWVVSADLDTLERTRLFRLYGGANTSVHISGKAFDHPGWVLVSTYNCSNPGAWSCEKVFAVDLDPVLDTEERIVNLAHTYNCGDNYWTETHGVANRDFTRVYFNSDSGSCGIDAEVHLLELPGPLPR